MSTLTFWQRDMISELHAAHALTVSDVQAPSAHTSLEQLAEELLDPELRGTGAWTWSNALNPWTTRELPGHCQIVGPGQVLDARAGDRLRLNVDWELKATPRPLREERHAWTVQRAVTVITLERGDRRRRESHMTVPLLDAGTATSSLTGLLPATVGCIIETLTEIAFPGQMENTPAEAAGSSLTEWTQLHRDRAIRLAAWHAQNARHENVGALHLSRPPRDLFVRPHELPTRPRGRDALIIALS